MPLQATPDSLIRSLGLKPHPEGGYFAEVFRDADGDGDGRARSTAIYFMLKAGEVSRWHKVDAAEVWHHYAGAPLELTMQAGDQPRTVHIVGTDFVAGQRPMAVVPPNAWQMARPLGEWVLVGCTVAPGFDFAGFVLAEPGFEPPGG